MNYQYHYDRLIETRKNRVHEEGIYYENHHIVMRSMGGSNDPENLVKLTAREHFLAHWLLWRIHRNRQTAYAFYLMCGNWKSDKMKRTRESRSSSRGFAEAREAHSIHRSLVMSKNLPMTTSVCENCDAEIIDVCTKPRRFCSNKCKNSHQMRLNTVPRKGQNNHDAVVKGWTSQSPEQRRSRALKAWETRRNKTST